MTAFNRLFKDERPLQATLCVPRKNIRKPSRDLDKVWRENLGCENRQRNIGAWLKSVFLRCDEMLAF